MFSNGDRGGGWRGGNPGGKRGNWRGGRGWWRGRGGNYSRGRGNQSKSASPVSSYSGDLSQDVVRPNEVRRQTTLYDVPSPYASWKLYFPEEVYSPTSRVVTRIQTFIEYMKSCKLLSNMSAVEERGFFILDFKDLLSNKDVSAVLPDLSAEMQQSPEVVINCLSLAGYQLLFDALGPDNRLSDSKNAYSLAKLHCRISNYDVITPLKHLKANYYGKFISIKGTVVRVSCFKPLCVQMAYECSVCATIQSVKWSNGKCTLPTKCPGQECRSRTFTAQRSHPLTWTIDCQTIRIQEQMSDDNSEAGRIPRTVDCELTYDLVDGCVPGDIVTVSGIVKVISSNEEMRHRQKDQCMFLLYIEANSIVNNQGRPSTSSSSSAPGSQQQMTSGCLAMEFTVKELYAIEEIHSEKHLFRLIIGSLCPSIYGHEMVKAGLILGLFGGTQKFVNDKNRIPVRGDPHILVVGDPGLGKSQMLQAVSNLGPRSVYVCANTTTTSGLTVTLTKEAGSGDTALEAGALVLADQGCCCVDEFDKLGNHHQALLEAMEQQTISIAKAGIVCSLPARTSIIAAANPSGGHYNKAKTVSENLRMGSALLSRFDLVFILLDRPDEDMDCRLSEHVMSLHAGRNRSITSTPSSSVSSQCVKTLDNTQSRQSMQSEMPLSERLKIPRNEPFDPIPPQLLRKYIGYARQYVHPKLGPEAATVLQNFYLDLRRKHQTHDSTPITTRQLESMIRLTEARTRLELREESTAQDAMDVVEIMKYSMIDTFSDEFGLLDFHRSQHGSGMSSKSQAKKFISLLQRRSKVTSNNLFSTQDLQQVAKEGSVKVNDFETFLSSLNDQGYILKKGPRLYQLQATDY